MRLQAVHVSQNPRYSLERDLETGNPFFGIPVSNSLADYTEWYSISELEFEQFLADADAAGQFAARCGRRELDDRLLLKPGRERGFY
jgi:hypothetical protein